MKLTAICPVGFDNFPQVGIFPFVSRLGIDTVHVVRDKLVKLPCSQVHRILADYQLNTDCYHGAFGSQIDLAGESASQRQLALDILAREAEFARDLGVRLMIIHPAASQIALAGARDNFLRSMERLVRIMEDFDLCGLLENLPPTYNYGGTLETLSQDVRSFQSPHVGICLDLGHANMRTDQFVADQIRATKGFIHYIHASDNDGQADRHLLPMTGNAHWESIFEALNEVGYKGSICLEVFESPISLEEKITSQWHDRLMRFLST
ncbi:MAG: sugar phosphate isomerase/epimerase [Phycisphaerae bacterium]|jgi:D-psicose/D-tagatose/L-ribulose 3-epimerase|nr:sugar phosphate isomerase/epimerase [Phycisphaerae bacterium]